MKKFTFYGFCKGALGVLSLLALIFIFLLNFIYNAAVSYNAYEKVSFENHVYESVVMLLIIFAVIVVLSVFAKRLEKINSSKLFKIFTVVYSVMALYLIINVDNTIRADAGTVFTTAKNVAEGIYKAFESGGYIDRYPHQTGLLFYDGIIQVFGGVASISFVANFAFVIGINYFTVKIADVMFKNNATNVITTIVSFAFLPQFFFILFAYGLTPGFFFMTLAFYNAIKFSHTKSISNAAFAAIGAGVAVCFKQNFLIGAIAIAIYLVLRIFAEEKKNKLRFVAVLLCFVALLFLPTEAVKGYYQLKTGIKLEQGTPSVLWVAMGTDIDNRYLGPGWYTGFNYSSYTQSGYNSEKAAELGKIKLSENIEKIKADPEKAAKFFLDKTKSQWCEPMFQSVWSGPLSDCGQNTHTKLLQSIYTGKSAESVIATFSKILVISIFAFASVFLVLKGKDSDGWEIALMFFIGGLLFHTVWEGKSQYIYPYVFSLIPFASCGIKALTEKLSIYFERKEINAEE